MCKKFSFEYLLAILCIIFQPNHFPQVITTITNEIISQGDGKFVAYTPCNKLTGSRGVFVGIGSLVCITNLIIAPVGDVLMRLGCWGKGTEDFSRQLLFSTWETIIVKPILVLGNSFLF